jgi:hypothetical protein
VIVTPQFLAGLILGIALGVVGIALITEWVSVRRSDRLRAASASAKRSPLTLTVSRTRKRR